jgi:hypothetical protein
LKLRQARYFLLVFFTRYDTPTIIAIRQIEMLIYLTVFGSSLSIFTLTPHCQERTVRTAAPSV